MKKNATEDLSKAYREEMERTSFDGVLWFINNCDDSNLLNKIDRVLGGKLTLLANGIIEDKNNW